MGWRRFLGIRLVSESKENVPFIQYKFLGYLLAIELLIRVFLFFSTLIFLLIEYKNKKSKNNSSTEQEKEPQDNEDLKDNPPCSLCLCPREHPTATLWSCILLELCRTGCYQEA